MNAQTASYYRAILFNDGQDERKLPESLIRLHNWSLKCCQALGISSTIPKATALAVAMQWMASTEDGRAFTRTSTTLGDIFSEPADSQGVNDASAVKWKDVKPGTPVVALAADGKPTQGVFVDQRMGWIAVAIDGKEQSFRISQVKLVGA
jgi:hypothetical protein